MDESSLGTSFRFVAFMNNLDEENCTKTPSFTLSDISWKVRICKTLLPGKSENLDVYLEADIRDKSIAVEAKGIFNIRRNTNNLNDVFQNSMDWKTFTADNPSHVIRNFLMTTFYTDYLSNEKLRFNIDITTKPMEKIDVEYETDYVATKIRAVINSVHRLNNAAYNVSTPDIVLKGIKWNVVVKLHNESLVVIINADENDLETDFQTRITATIRLLPYSYNRTGQTPEPLKFEINPTFYKGSSSHRVILLPWSKFIAPNTNYIIKDTASLLVDIKVGSKERVSHFDF